MIRITACALVLAFSPCMAGEMPAHTHEHDHADHSAPQQGDALQPYATDAPLRAGMSAIGELLRGTAADAPAPVLAQLADGIDSEVQQIFRDCRLPPDADAALHGILASLLQAVSELRQPPVAESTWSGLNQALQSYQKQFDHPGFAAPELH